jgi:hypothetical protein
MVHYMGRDKIGFGRNTYGQPSGATTVSPSESVVGQNVGPLVVPSVLLLRPPSLYMLSVGISDQHALYGKR